MHRQNRRDRAPVQPLARWGLALGLSLVVLAACSRQVTPTVISPIQSPAPPTQMVSPSPTVPLASPTNSPATPLGCALRPHPRIEATWQRWLRADLGCPRREAQEIPVAFQEFERGFMLWKGVPEFQVYVLLLGDGTRPMRWSAYVDTFQEGQPAFDPLLTPPPEREQPIRGFGKVWREQPGVREAIGWALSRERGGQGVFQVFEGGRVFVVEDTRLFALIDTDNRWQEFPVTSGAP